MTTDEREREKARARQQIEDAKAKHWRNVEMFDGTRLIVGDDYDFLSLRAETVVGGTRKVLELGTIPPQEMDAAQAEAIVLNAVEWVSEQHRA